MEAFVGLARRSLGLKSTGREEPPEELPEESPEASPEESPEEAPDASSDESPEESTDESPQEFPKEYSLDVQSLRYCNPIDAQQRSSTGLMEAQYMCNTSPAEGPSWRDAQWKSNQTPLKKNKKSPIAI